jgi:hypothetical protein
MVRTLAGGPDDPASVAEGLVSRSIAYLEAERGRLLEALESLGHMKIALAGPALDGFLGICGMLSDPAGGPEGDDSDGTARKSFPDQDFELSALTECSSLLSLAASGLDGAVSGLSGLLSDPEVAVSGLDGAVSGLDAFPPGALAALGALGSRALLSEDPVGMGDRDWPLYALAAASARNPTLAWLQGAPPSVASGGIAGGMAAFEEPMSDPGFTFRRRFPGSAAAERLLGGRRRREKAVSLAQEVGRISDDSARIAACARESSRALELAASKLREQTCRLDGAALHYLTGGGPVSRDAMNGSLRRGARLAGTLMRIVSAPILTDSGELMAGAEAESRASGLEASLI